LFISVPSKDGMRELLGGIQFREQRFGVFREGVVGV
jgi:hypothetical protein